LTWFTNNKSTGWGWGVGGGGLGGESRRRRRRMSRRNKKKKKCKIKNSLFLLSPFSLDKTFHIHPKKSFKCCFIFFTSVY